MFLAEPDGTPDRVGRFIGQRWPQLAGFAERLVHGEYCGTQPVSGDTEPVENHRRDTFTQQAQEQVWAGHLGAADQACFFTSLIEASLQTRLHWEPDAARIPLPDRLFGHTETCTDLGP